MLLLSLLLSSLLYRTDSKKYVVVVVVVVVVVMTSPSGSAYIGGPMPRRDDEFRQVVTVMEYICDVNGVTKVPLAFCCPFRTEEK